MFLTENQTINEKGHFTLNGADTVELAEHFGTPLYVMDENHIRKVMREYKDSIDRFYGGNGLVLYASKAFSCKEIYRICNDEGIGADVVSGGELYTALEAGLDPSVICFHGNSKSIAEIEFAVKNRVGRIVADNLDELERIDAVSAQNGVITNVLLRLKPGIDAHTHDFVKTGHIGSKFGFAMQTGEAFDAADFCISHDNLKLCGIHCHIGSQIFDADPFELASEVMVDFMAKVRDELDYEMTELNLGGGFGIKYTETDDPKDYPQYMSLVSKALIAECEKQGMNVPYIMVEPGRSIVGAAGVTLYSVSAAKQIPDICNYVLVDGGMCDNPRYALYRSQYEALVANKASEEKTELVSIGGKCCESGDLIGEKMPLQKAVANDIIAVLSTGAYNYSMAMNYNRNPKPPVIFIKDGSARIVVRGESYEDLVRNDT